MCVYIYTHIYVYICMYVYICIYVLSAYTRHWLSNVNVKNYRSHSNFGLVGPSISFWHPKQVPVSVANTEPRILPHPHVVNNAHLITWTPLPNFSVIGP